MKDPDENCEGSTKEENRLDEGAPSKRLRQDTRAYVSSKIASAGHLAELDTRLDENYMSTDFYNEIVLLSDDVVLNIATDKGFEDAVNRDAKLEFLFEKITGRRAEHKADITDEQRSKIVDSTQSTLECIYFLCMEVKTKQEWIDSLVETVNSIVNSTVSENQQAKVLKYVKEILMNRKRFVDVASISLNAGMEEICAQFNEIQSKGKNKWSRFRGDVNQLVSSLLKMNQPATINSQLNELPQNGDEQLDFNPAQVAKFIRSVAGSTINSPLDNVLSFQDSEYYRIREEALRTAVDVLVRLVSNASSKLLSALGQREDRSCATYMTDYDDRVRHQRTEIERLHHALKKPAETKKFLGSCNSLYTMVWKSTSKGENEKNNIAWDNYFETFLGEVSLIFKDHSIYREYIEKTTKYAPPDSENDQVQQCHLIYHFVTLKLPSHLTIGHKDGSTAKMLCKELDRFIFFLLKPVNANPLSTGTQSLSILLLNRIVMYREERQQIENTEKNERYKHDSSPRELSEINSEAGHVEVLYSFERLLLAFFSRCNDGGWEEWNEWILGRCILGQMFIDGVLSAIELHTRKPFLEQWKTDFRKSLYSGTRCWAGQSLGIQEDILSKVNDLIGKCHHACDMLRTSIVSSISSWVTNLGGTVDGKKVENVDMLRQIADAIMCDVHESNDDYRQSVVQFVYRIEISQP